MRRRKADSLVEARTGLLAVLVGRAEQLTEKQRFDERAGRWVKRRAAWPIIQAACFVESRRWAGVRTVEPGRRGVSAPLLGVAVASNLGMGEKRRRRGAKQRLAVLLCIAGRLVAWRGGLRLEEMSAMTGIPEETLWPVLKWAKRERVFVDLGERGWFIDTPDGTGPGSVAELRREATAA